MAAQCASTPSVGRGLVPRHALVPTAQRCVAVRAEVEEPRTTSDTIFYGGSNYKEAEVRLRRSSAAF